MPTPAFSSKVIDFNRLQKTGKHYTNDEITRRREAEEKLKRKIKTFLSRFLNCRDFTHRSVRVILIFIDDNNC